MVKLNEIKIIGVSHPNIFVESKENQTLECIDMVLDITYKVDRNSVDFEENGIEKESTDEDLQDVFASYMMVWLEGDSYKYIDNFNYDNFNYSIICDVNSNVNEIQDISEEEMKKAFEAIKEYVKTEEFLKLITYEFDIHK